MRDLVPDVLGPGYYGKASQLWIVRSITVTEKSASSFTVTYSYVCEALG